MRIMSFLIGLLLCCNSLFARPDPDPGLGVCCYGEYCYIVSSRDACWAPGIYIPSVTCLPRNLCDADEFYGACCIDNSNVCAITAALSCNGTFLGTGSACTPGVCLEQELACCTPNGCFMVRGEYNCYNLAGIPLGTVCNPEECPPNGSNFGACCIEDECVIKEVLECWATGGTFYNKPCADVICSKYQPCCQGNTCTMVEPVDCSALEGTILPGATCTPNPCGIQGACCIGNDSGQCRVTVQENCKGLFYAAGVCSPNPCNVNFGACCIENFTCVITKSSQCNGVYLGNETLCQNVFCTSEVGACCNLLTGACTMTSSLGCANYSLFFQGNGTSCTPTLCPDPLEP
jgi:hypothetical protein